MSGKSALCLEVWGWRVWAFDGQVDWRTVFTVIPLNLYNWPKNKSWVRRSDAGRSREPGRVLYDVSKKGDQLHGLKPRYWQIQCEALSALVLAFLTANFTQFCEKPICLGKFVGVFVIPPREPFSKAVMMKWWWPLWSGMASISFILFYLSEVPQWHNILHQAIQFADDDVSTGDCYKVRFEIRVLV